MVGGSSTSSKSPRSTSPFRSKKGSPSPFCSPAIKNVAGRPASPSSERPEFSKPKENVTVTVRFRPLSAREMKQGNEIAWYADGDCTVRNEVNPKIAYAFDRVFGPATTTRHVYDIAAHHVVSGAMEGINGTIFAYGVTSSGKTHTMHGLQKSPGIIPLAVKDVFEIIQETPGREFLLRVSYLEIYNEVINDLLDPAGQSLRIREDTQGTYIEGIKDEVVLSPAHALSLIATGEAHRHVGSNNFNLLSSRSHTIFTLTIESSPHGQSQGEEDVSLSQLHLIDLAGSESSKIETNGLRRKEGSYINKSLLTLGTVISKLTDGKASHIPYRDSKLTRLLQSSLSGHGRISLICTVTPASGHSEETHNTLKFAHRSKHVEIKASQNKILDEKSLIKKYQKEILSLKQELQTLKHGIPEDTCMNVSMPEDLVSLKLQLEAGQAQLQSSTEEEEQAKAALTGRIQRLTKLILVSTRNTPGTTHVPQKSVYTRRHSFGEEELAHLPDRTRENAICCDDSGGGSLDPEVPIDGCANPTNLHEIVKDYKKSKRKGMLGWFKSRKPELVGGLSPVATDDGQSSTSGSPATASRSSQNRVMASDVKEKQRKLVNRKQGDLPATNSSPEKGQTDEFLSTGIELSHINLTGTTIIDQLDVLQEQVKLLAEEVAQCTYSLKRLSGEAINSPENSRDEEQIWKLKNEITEKKLQIHQLEQCIIVSLEAAPQNVPRSELSQALAKIATQLSEKTFELEINSVDKRILREQLQMKISENAEMQKAILLLRQQLSTSSNICSIYPEGQNQSAMLNASALDSNPINLDERNKGGKDSPLYATTPTSVISLNRFFGQDDSKDCKNATNSSLQISNIENLKQENARLAEEKVGLEIHSQKLAEEASYAKELAAAAAIELQHLTEEVTRLSYQNAELIGELGSTKEVNSGSGCCQPLCDVNKNNSSYADIDASSRKLEYEQLVEYLQNELHTRYQRESMLEAALSEKEQVERELNKQLSEAKRHEEVLASDLENLWVLIENMRKTGIETDDVLSHKIGTSNYRSAEFPVGISSKGNLLSAGSQLSRNLDKISSAGASNLKNIETPKELEKLISRLKGEDLSGVDMATLEELQIVHVEAITKICQAKDLLDSIYTCHDNYSAFFREANRAADWLANYGLTLDQRMVLLEAVPKDFRAVLLEDLSGVAWVRKVPSEEPN